MFGLLRRLLGSVDKPSPADAPDGRKVLIRYAYALKEVDVYQSRVQGFVGEVRINGDVMLLRNDRTAEEGGVPGSRKWFPSTGWTEEQLAQLIPWAENS